MMGRYHCVHVCNGRVCFVCVCVCVGGGGGGEEKVRRKGQ